MILAILFVAGCCAGCVNQNDPGDVTSLPTTETAVITDKSGNTVAEENELDDNGFLKDNLPDTLDYGGKTITVLAWDGQSYEEFEAEALNGETINDALYKRNVAVKDRLGINLEFIKTKGGASNVDDYVIQVRSQAMTGTGEYDILAAYSRSIAMQTSTATIFRMTKISMATWDRQLRYSRFSGAAVLRRSTLMTVR